MKSQERIALIFLGSVVGMAGVAYARGRRGGELLTDAMLYGLAVGAAGNSLWYAAAGENPLAGIIPNPADFGRVPREAVKMLTSVDSDILSPMVKAGVKVALAPEDHHYVNQDAE